MVCVLLAETAVLEHLRGSLLGGQDVKTVKLVLAALMFGESVLLHCRQGKRSSGALCVLILALRRGTGIDGALEFYFANRSDLRNKDWYIVRSILDRMTHPQLLETLQQQG